MVEPASPKLSVSLSEASGVPFYRQIVDQIAELVRSAQLPAGYRLPSVRELTAQLLVSVITVRRAYADLEQAGLIVRRQGQGTFVAKSVAAASRRHARSEARKVLRAAVVRASQLGMGSAAQRKLLESLWRDIDA